mgnify:FL=1
MDRSDEFPCVHPEARPVEKGQGVLKRAAGMKKMGRSEKGIKAYRRGGMWYDPMCFPELGTKADR